MSFFGDTRLEKTREYKTYAEPTRAEVRVRMNEAPVTAQRLQADTPKRSTFNRLVNRGNRLIDGGLSALDHASSGLHKIRDALSQTTFSASSRRVTTGLSEPAPAAGFAHKAAENHDREAAPTRNINFSLLQVNVHNEKGPGFASKVVNTVAGAVGSLASARHGFEEVKTDAARASTLGGRALGLGLSAIKLGARTFKKHVLE